MKIGYNVPREQRKEMVKLISEVLDGAEIKYLRVPSCSYLVGGFEVTRTMELVYEDDVEQETVDKVLNALSHAGYQSEDALVEKESEEEEETMEEQQTAVEGDLVTISLPNDLDEQAKQNLDAIIAGRKTLFQEAFESKSLTYEERDGQICFPWFHNTSGEEIDAYSLFLTRLIRYAKESKRITAKDKAADNPRYAFRCFLLRLGFIGQEFKAARKILLRPLSGSSSFRDQHRKGENVHEVSE